MPEAFATESCSRSRLGPEASVEEWKELEKRLERREGLLYYDVQWLRQELVKRKKK